MRSLFWRIFWIFWLAIVLIGGLTFALGKWLSEERWMMSFYPNLSAYAPKWVALYEKEGLAAAQEFSAQQARDNNIQANIFSVDGDQLTSLMSRRDINLRRWSGSRTGTRTETAPETAPETGIETDSKTDPETKTEALSDASPGAGVRTRTRPGAGTGAGTGGRARGVGQSRFNQDVRRVNHEHTSESGNQYIFRFQLPSRQVRAWQSRLSWPLITIVALLAVTLASWLLSLMIARPVHRLRDAVEKLEKTDFQSAQLAHISGRRDELGMLAREFVQMGENLQTQIASQRQLLRDVSHELRSPLARLRVALGLAERQAETRETPPETWEKLHRECNRLDRLIDEILTLSRFDSQAEAAQPVNLSVLLQGILTEFPDLPVKLDAPAALWVQGWPVWLEKALSNVLRNASRFNPPDVPLDIAFSTDSTTHTLRLRDHGPGCDPALLPRLCEPFLRAPGQQQATGYGLGLAIAKRAIERHGGTIVFSLPPDGGFQVEIALPAAAPTIQRSLAQ